MRDHELDSKQHKKWYTDNRLMLKKFARYYLSLDCKYIISSDEKMVEPILNKPMLDIKYELYNVAYQA